MANALSALNGPPPAPDIPDQPQGNALGMPPRQMPAGASAAPMLPPPSHQQTVAALRHFDAIKQELIGLLKDPDCGKADMKSQIQDGAVRLVASGIATPAQAVTQLGSVPQRPYDQKKWLEQQLVQAVQGANIVLDHHRIGFAGDATPGSPPNPDDHHTIIASLTSQYKGGANG